MPMAASSTSGNNRLAIAAAPAARRAHLKTKARRRFDSSHSTAVNRKAPMKMIAEASAGRPFHLPPITDPRRRVPLVVGLG